MALSLLAARRVCVASSSVPRVFARSLHVGTYVAVQSAPLRVAMLGAGRIGQQHAQTLAALPQTELVAVVDPVETAARSVAEKWGIPTFGTDEGVVLGDGVDAVFVCSPTPEHARQSIAAARAGKHVFCEKPVSLDIPVIKNVLDEVAAAGIKFQVGFNRRFDSNFRRVQRAVADGEVGRLHQVRITSRDPGPPPIEYVKVSGGMMLDMTIHDFDLARFVVGTDVPAVEVFCTASCMVDPAIGEAGDVDTAVVVIKFANGVMATIDNSRQAVYGYDQRLEAFGSGGAASAGNNSPTNVVVSTAERVYAGDLIHHFFMERYKDAYRDIAVAFVDAVVNDTPVQVGGSDGLESVRLGLAAMKSFKENRVVPMSEIDA